MAAAFVAALVISSSGCNDRTQSGQSNRVINRRPVSPDSSPPCVDRLEADAAGSLPADGAAIIGGRQLPSGHVVIDQLLDGGPTTTSEPLVQSSGRSPGPGFTTRIASHDTTRPRATQPVTEGTPGRPVMWVTDDHVSDPAGTWVELARAFPDTGLWPLLLTDLDGDPWWDDSVRFAESTRQADADRAEPFLDGSWSLLLHPEASDVVDNTVLGIVAPFGDTFPGLADAIPTGECDVDLFATATDLTDPAHIALVAVTRPADSIAGINYAGPINYEFDPFDVASVLRSWEDRFGAVVVSLDLDLMTVIPQRLPRDRRQKELLAAEHFALAPDNIFQDTETLDAYVQDLDDYETWDFWWL